MSKELAKGTDNVVENTIGTKLQWELIWFFDVSQQVARASLVHTKNITQSRTTPTRAHIEHDTDAPH